MASSWPLRVGLDAGEDGYGRLDPLGAFVVIVGECRERRGEMLTRIRNVD